MCECSAILEISGFEVVIVVIGRYNEAQAVRMQRVDYEIRHLAKWPRERVHAKDVGDKQISVFYVCMGSMSECLIASELLFL